MAGKNWIKLSLENIEETKESNINHLQAKVGHDKEFQVALQRLRGKDADITREAAEIKVLSIN